MKEDKKSKKRFEKIYTDPMFKPIPKLVQKVEIKDNRFEAMFKNKDFISSTGIDEYGRKIESKKGNIQMENYYIKGEDKNEKKKQKNKKEKLKIEEKTKKKKNKKKQEKNKLEEEDGEESDTSEEFQEFLLEMQKENEEELNREKNEEENIPTGEATSRFAVQNLDWDNIHALDLFILFNSFCTGKQKVLKVEIYPSEYGMKEMAKENQQGPDKQIFTGETIVKTAENVSQKKENKN